MKIGILDSGIGGLNTMTEIASRCPNNTFVYYADDSNAPYGTKTDSELITLAYRAVEKLLSYNVEVIVVACNTLTTVTISYLRRRYKLPIIGAEPAIKPAIRDGGRIALLATPATARSARLMDLCGGVNVDVFAYGSLAGIIQSVVPDCDVLEPYLAKLCSHLDGYDSVVLGCTHYIYLKEIISRLFPTLRIYDGDRGIAERIRSIYTPSNHIIRPTFLVSSTEIERYRHIFGMLMAKKASYNEKTL